MAGEHRQSRKTRLALALAEGVSPRKWASKNKVSKSTAYRWAKEPKVKARANLIRRRAVDRAVGRLAKRVTWAAEGIVKLADNATSESVRLSALRAIYSEMMTGSKFGGLEDRMTQIEERLDAGTANAS